MRQAILIPVLLALLGGAAQGWAADFPDQVGSGYFRQQDTLPGRFRLYLQEQEKATGIWGLGPGHGRISKASFKIDAHEGWTISAPDGCASTVIKTIGGTCT